jgi:putative addiction module component (TIGR02574 family)
MTTVDTLMERIAQLSSDERLELRLRLIEIERGAEETGAEEAWGDEISRRTAAYDRGELSAVPATQVLREMDAVLRRVRA